MTVWIKIFGRDTLSRWFALHLQRALPEQAAFKQFREAERERREAEENRRKETVAECQRILTDPSVSEIDRTWAEQTLQLFES